MNIAVQVESSENQTASAGAIMPRHTVEAIVAKRNVALAKFDEAWAELNRASDAQSAAYAAWSAACSEKKDRYSISTRDEKMAFVKTIQMCPRKDYLATARRLVDVDVWSHVIQLTDLERLMDKTAKDQFHRELLENPPEATVDNICATLERFALDAGDIFKRGIATAFSKLDRRFKSHDGFKVGARLILDRMFDASGWWNHRSDMESTLIDVERALLVLDDHKETALYAGIVGQLRSVRSGGGGARQTEIENDYFKIRIFKNGNCHAWLKRKDLTRKVNKLLHEWYGETIADGQTAEADPLNNPKTTLAKRFGFFPTPDDAAERLMDGVPLWRDKKEQPLRVLEPSAGTGNLARRCIIRPSDKVGLDKWQRERLRDVEKDRRFDNQVDCVEVQPLHAEQLQAEGIYRKVYCRDFLSMQPDPGYLYDVIVMNPPFDLERDIDHVVHALKFLAPDGYLCAIMSAGTEWRETSKSIAFRKLIAEKGGDFRELPAGSFASVGTNVNTTVLRVRNGGRKRYW